MLFTSLWKLNTSEFDLPSRQSSLKTITAVRLPGSIDAARMAVAHMLLEVIFSLEHLLLIAAQANMANVHAVRMLYPVPQKGVTSRIHLATPSFVAPPGLVQRALTVLVEPL